VSLINKQVYLLLGAVVILAVGGYLIMVRPSGKNEAETLPMEQPVMEETMVEEKPATESSMMEANVVEIAVENKGLKFVPAEIKVKKGDKVKITFKNTGGSHDFVINEFGVKTAVLGAGKSETVEFSADKEGTYEYYCSVPGHRAAGMKGMLVVE
jgi:plastocyanin